MPVSSQSIARLVIAVLAVALVGTLVFFALARPPSLRSLANERGVSQLTIRAPIGYWQRERFTRLLPPVRLPSASAEIEQIEIWIRVPDGAQIGVEAPPGGGDPMLRVPPGTVVDRVEYAGEGSARFVADVRGTRFGDDGRERFRVLRPERPGPTGRLRGFEWDRGDAAQQREVTEALLAYVAGTPPFVTMSEEKRGAALTRLRQINDCAGCHQPMRAANTRLGEHGRANRRTDASGMFTPQTVLEDAAPVEIYRPRDPNVGDPFIAIRCGDAPASRAPPRAPGGPPGHARCPGAKVPVATYDMERALAAGAPRARAVCDAREYLYSYLDEAARVVFEPALRVCRERGS
ncbi:MAG: hypothetical protein H6713_41410 [Myxococcales bacterium]|nr:hypothetical protein [Myxococcales bacterium]